MNETAQGQLAVPAPERRPRLALAGRLGDREKALRLGGLAVVVAVAAVLDTVRLAQNGYANLFYSAGVRSMLRSLHNFFFVSSDPNGLVTMDKPPLALWMQAASAKVFGFHPLSLLLPNALVGVAVSALLYVIVARRFGTATGLAAGIACAVFPSFVAVSRANGVDTLLILLMLAACGAAIRACESGRWRSLVLAAVFVGLAFNTKTLAAYLVVPGIAFAYAVCGPGSFARRALQLALAGVLAGVVSFAWIAVVEATPASKRPYIGSSTNNSEIGLTFNYNGFGRVEGQEGGPGDTHGRPGARVTKAVELRVDRQRERERHIKQPPPNPRAKALPPAPHKSARDAKPIPFGGPPGPFRLFGVGLGDQGGWLLPLAFFGLLAALLALLLPAERREGTIATGRMAAARVPARARPHEDEPPPAGRRDPRLAATIVLGGWFLVEALVLSASKGIVHPYYASALAPGTGAMAGIGVWAIVDLCRRPAGTGRFLGIAMAALAVGATLTAEIVLMHRYQYLLWFIPVLAVAAIVCLVALTAAALRGRRGPASAIALAAAFGLLIVVPAGYASTTWLAPVQSTFPAAGPKQAAGQGGVGLDPKDQSVNLAILHYVRTHGVTQPYELFTVSAPTAAPMVLLGYKVSNLAGYSGTDPVMDGPQLARLVERGEARYVLLGGEYSSRGGNKATKAVLAACRELAPFEWKTPAVHYTAGLVLFDCGADAAKLAAQP